LRVDGLLDNTSVAHFGVTVKHLLEKDGLKIEYVMLARRAWWLSVEGTETQGLEAFSLLCKGFPEASVVFDSEDNFRDARLYTQDKWSPVIGPRQRAALRFRF
jgi:hypothetical protein